MRSEKQATEERERREILELEEAFRDNKKTGIPANVSTGKPHLQMTFDLFRLWVQRSCLLISIEKVQNRTR